MERVRKVTAGIFLAVLVVLGAVPVPVSRASGQEITLTSKENAVVTYHADGQPKTWTLVLTNHTDQDIAEALVAPEMGATNEEWPFQTHYQSYQQVIAIPKGESVEVPFEFIQREDVPTARYTIQFTVTVEGEVKAAQRFYVNTTAKENVQVQPEITENPENAENVEIPQEQAEASQEQGANMEEMMLADAGGISNGGAVYSGGGSTGSASVPRVIVTGFTTDPAEVRAGSNFTLTVHLKNTSKSTKVRNMLFDLSAPTEGKDEQTMSPAFLPASGSSSIYLEEIKANGTADISIQLNAKADLVQKPYSIDLSMKYEDGDAAQIEASSSVSIPVKQDARFEFSEFEISPQSIEVGEEANVMCNLYNLGRIKLYNVKAIFEGACIEKEEVFLGNVESGATASIDAMLEGKNETEGPANITMTLSYEDESGNISEVTKDLQLEVMNADMGDMAAAEMPQEEAGGFPVLPVILLAALAVVIVVIVIVAKKRKKRQMLSEEEELLDELDGPSSDE